MGDIADFYLETCFSFDGDDDALWIPRYSRRGPAPSVTCRYCSRSGLVWGNTSEGYRLFENGKQHVCDYSSAFDDLTKEDDK